MSLKYLRRSAGQLICALGVFAGSRMWVPAATAHAQASVQLPAAVSCSQCRVALEPVLTLGGTSPHAMLDAEINLVTRDSRGRYYVANGESPTVWVFGADGALVSRLGREGAGPGEFRRPTAFVAGPSDSLYVFDASLSRMTVFGPDLSFARATALAFRPDLFDVAFVGSSIVLNANIRSPERAGLPLHVIARSGEIARSFGSETGVYRPDLGYGSRRALALGLGGSVWAAALNSYVLQRWDTAGRLLATIRREVEWFPTYWRYDVNAALPPPPSISALAQVGDTLWVMVKVADANWRTAVESTSPDGRFFRVLDQHGYRDTMLEAIDVRSRRIIVSSRVPQLLWGFLDTGLAYGPGEDADGNPVVRVFRAHIVQE